MNETIKRIEEFDINSDTFLDLSNLNLTKIPDHPKMQFIKKLYCSDNKLISLPDSYYNLIHLYCSDNELTNLPDSYINLTHLYCSHNQLISLSDSYINLR